MKFNIESNYWTRFRLSVELVTNITYKIGWNALHTVAFNLTRHR